MMPLRVVTICVALICYMGLIGCLVEISKLIGSTWACWLAGVVATVGVIAATVDIISGDI